MRFPVLPVAVALGLLGCGATPRSATGPDRFHYRARLSPDLQRMEVRACFWGSPPTRLVAGTSAAAHAVSEIRGPWGSLAAPRDRVRSLPPLASGECVDYDVDLARVPMRRAGALVTQASTWLWRPSPTAPGASGTVRFELPQGTSAAVPWPRAERGYAIDGSTFRFLSHAAFGDLATDRFRAAGVDVQIVRLPGQTELDGAGIRAWLRAAVSAGAQLFGAFPVSRLQAVVVPVGPGPRPVAFGNVGRGGGASVMLLLRENAKLDSLGSDWVTVHEFVHLAMPYVRRADAWLSEGMATYYQEVLRARAGLQTPIDAWRAIDAGFRSAADRRTGRTLREDSATMYRTGAFARVYWAGAAWALMIDVELRRRAGPVGSLDDALARLHACCGPASEPWSARRLLRRIDEECHMSLFREQSARHLAGRELPDAATVFERLGLSRGADGQLVLVDGPESAIRDAIMAPRLARRRTLAPSLAP